MKKTNNTEGAKGDPIKEYAITSAVIKDDFCNYSFDVLDGVGVGDTHNVKGRGIVLDDLKDAFAKFNVHLAAIDDVFKHSGVDVKNIDKMRSHEHTALYICSGFKIKGSEESKMLILMGSKFVSVGGYVSVETPQVLLDKFSSYIWWKELRDALDVALLEVEDYKEGKCVPVVKDDFIDPKQSTMMEDPNFDSAKV